MDENTQGRRGGPGSPDGNVGRNAPCPCGSGRKYKRCCGREAGASGAPGPADELPDITLEELKDVLPPGRYEEMVRELGNMDEKGLGEFLKSFDEMDEEEVAGIAGETEESGELSEDQAWKVALSDHPEYAEALEEDELPSEITGPDGNVMNPRLHLALHAILERQMAADKPRGVAGIMRRLVTSGVSRHEALHRMAFEVSDQVWYMLKEGCPFDEERYVEKLENLARRQEKDSR